MDTEKAKRKDVLLKVHEFYTEDARHQRSMMWETVKWFTPILVTIHGSWWWIFLNKLLKAQNPEPEIWCSLFFLVIGGIVFSAICLRLLNSFYKTNLIYVTMFAKAEDELDFDRRVKGKVERNAFPEDNCITYKKYRKDRKNLKKDKDFIKFNLRKGKMYLWMKSVFHLFILGFLIEFLWVLLEITFGKNMHSSEKAGAVICLIGIYFGSWLIEIALPTLQKPPKQIKKE